MPQRLIEGIHSFQREDFGQHEALFRDLAERGQRPLAGGKGTTAIYGLGNAPPVGA